MSDDGLPFDDCVGRDVVDDDGGSPVGMTLVGSPRCGPTVGHWGPGGVDLQPVSVGDDNWGVVHGTTVVDDDWTVGGLDVDLTVRDHDWPLLGDG